MALTKEQAKEVVREGGSNQIQEQPDVPFVTTVDNKNYLSSWVVVPSSKPKIKYSQVEQALDVQVTELRPNIPEAPTTFISKEQYDTLLSQSIELNATIDELRTEVINLNTKVGDLETRTDSEINQRLSFQQTNLVLVNQLTSLSDTVNGFGEQISNAIQKSVEESIFRTSLQAQNEGFKAQIQALITQADSLNAIITGLYGQLGAAQVQQEIENDAQSLAQSLQGITLNNVVITEGILPEGGLPYKNDYGSFDLFAHVNNKGGNEMRWLAGGDFTFENVNNLDATIKIEITYPRESINSTVPQRFFKLEGQGSNLKQQFTFQIPGKTKKVIKYQYTKDGIQSGLIETKGLLIGQPKSKYFTVGGQIMITVNIQGFKDVQKGLRVGLGIMHPNSY